ncbi:hypothetical protein B0H14DRAFT_3130516 [Mycena olivaceomarginata]|nr:hypothetical protein B0H14DRAFT_3130516 [Mycena olivaceomarginata]
MRSFIVLLLIFPAALSARLPVFNGPSSTTEIQDGQTGTLIVLPPQATETGLKQILDAAHPFIAPGPSDQRGPAMNTLRTMVIFRESMHHYAPASGIASFEQIVLAMMEAWACSFQSRFDCAWSPTIWCAIGENSAKANDLLGNPFTNQVSIGGVSPLVPPLPGGIDGPSVGGIAKLVASRALLQLGKFGDNGPDGENTVFNIPTFIEIKKQNIMMDQATNPKFELAAGRLNAAYAEAAFILEFVPSTSDVKILLTHHKASNLTKHRLIFRNQTFPANWFRASSPVTGVMIGATIAQIAAAIPIPPGRNNAQGVYVADPPPPAPWNSSAVCLRSFNDDHYSTEPS